MDVQRAVENAHGLFRSRSTRCIEDAPVPRSRTKVVLEPIKHATARLADLPGGHLYTPRLTEVNVIEQVSRYVLEQLNNEPTGHDWWHAERVRLLGREFAQKEGANTFVVELASLLHDIRDYKLGGSDEESAGVAATVLRRLGVRPKVVSEVQEIILRISFKGAATPEQELTLEGECVQDADRMDALGAIGIARTFAYGGYARRPIYDPDRSIVLATTRQEYVESAGTTINHFHEKLFLLGDRLKTATARRLVRSRHDFMVKFLEEFEREWNGADILDLLNSDPPSESF